MADPTRRRRLEVEDVGDVAVVLFTDEKILGELEIQTIGDEIYRLVDDLGRRKLLLNFTNVKALSSAVLAMLMKLNRKLTSVQGKLVLCNIAKNLREPFVITKIDTYIKMADTEQDGLQAF